MADGDKNLAWKIAATFIGSVVGAGFASGQELSQFFLGYGHSGSYGVACAGLLFALWGAGLCELTARRGLADYSDYLRWLLGRMGAIGIDLLISLFLFCTVFIMLSAGNALFAEHFGLPPAWGSIATGLAVLAVLWGGLDSLVSFNIVLVPVKFLICLAVFLLVWRQGSLPPLLPVGRIAPICPSWFGASLLYVGFNMLGAMVVLIPLSLRGPASQRLAGNLLGGFGLGAFGLLIFQILMPFRYQVAGWEMPVLVIAGLVHPGLQCSYFAVLWAAILSTAIVSCYGVATRIRGWLAYRPALILTLAASLALARFQFSFLVRLIYPLFGGVGMLLLAAHAARALGLRPPHR